MQTSTHTHTPGPWKVADRGQIGAPLTERPWFRRVAEIVGDSPTSQANARLIAAAPVLLDALAALVDVQDKREAGDISWDFAWADARAAIAAATGEDV